MQKVYQLLRNNKQLGPFTLEELKAQNIVASDLIWVEGKSAAWQFPHEISVLEFEATSRSEPRIESAKAIYLQKQPVQQNSKRDKSVFVSLPKAAVPNMAPVQPAPVDALEQKAEAIRQRVQTFAQTQQMEMQPDEVHSGWARSMAEVEEENARWIVKQKAQKKKEQNRKRLIAALPLVIIVSAGAYFIVPKSSTPSETGVNKPETSYSENNNPEIASNVPATAVVGPDFNTNEASDAVAIKKTEKNTEKEPVIIINAENTSAQQTTATTTDDEVLAESNAPEAQTQTETAPPQKEKKTIGEAIDQFFGKFKSKKEEGAESGTTKKESNGERRATKRNDVEAATPQEEVSVEKVTVRATEPAQDWMLGVRGVKLTLNNQNNQPLASAVVEVSYFDEQNALLEKKSVIFRNVPAHKSITLPAPDHRMASSISYQILSISGK